MPAWMNRKRIAISGVIVALIGIAAWVSWDQLRPAPQASSITGTSVSASRLSAADYVGANSCASCHQAQFDAWKGSHHAQAMQHADEKTVLGNFDDTRFQYNAVVTRFFRRDGRFMVNTDGADGSLQDFEIKYTFGVYPLQQYLIEFPGGRLQALGVSWDARPKAEGGQRWFHQYPKEKVDHKDELHWTKLAQNWNYMCSACHSTNLKKNFDLTKNEFKTSWSEINVACESCHGPASRHLAWAKKEDGAGQFENKGLTQLLDERRNANWTHSTEARTAQRGTPRTTSKEIETCGACHARRSALVDGAAPGTSFMDAYLPSLLTAPMFHPDGQIKEEDFEYSSFLQSKMHSKGVTCSDCHEPHSQKLRAPGNATCLQCHSADYFASKKHHLHETGSKGAECVACHMPTTNFMVVHARHDHSLRVPRPDLSITLKTPNACNQCHTDKSPAWADAKLKQHFGKDWPPGWHFGETLHAANQGVPTAGQDIVALAASPQFPDIARATATSHLSEYMDRVTLAVLPRLLQDKSPMVRRAALSALAPLPPEQQWRLGKALLTDPVLGVRIEAARLLAGTPRQNLEAADRQALDRGVEEYIRAMQANAEHPQTHVNLGLLYAAQGDNAKAEAAYQQAMKLDPAYAFAYVNLADLYARQGQIDKAGELLAQARKAVGESAEIEHAIGLHFIRKQQTAEALAALAKASRLRPDIARYGYVYAIALHDTGAPERAVKVLVAESARHPNDRAILSALIGYNQELGKPQLALQYAKALNKLDPNLGTTEQLLRGQ